MKLLFKHSYFLCYKWSNTDSKRPRWVQALIEEEIITEESPDNWYLYGLEGQLLNGNYLLKKNCSYFVVNEYELNRDYIQINEN